MSSTAVSFVLLSLIVLLIAVMFMTSYVKARTGDVIEQMTKPIAPTVIHQSMNLIKEFEGFRSLPYRDVGGKWTVGYGYRIKSEEELQLYFSYRMTERHAEELLKTFVERDLIRLRGVLRKHGVEVTTYQKVALVSFMYNVGYGAFRRSNLLRYLKSNDFDKAADDFLKWVHV